MCWQVKRPRAVILERCTQQVVGRVVKGEQYGLGKKRVGGRWAKRGCMRGELSVAQQIDGQGRTVWRANCFDVHVTGNPETQKRMRSVTN
jgi:hypothetical protein